MAMLSLRPMVSALVAGALLSCTSAPSDQKTSHVAVPPGLPALFVQTTDAQLRPSPGDGAAAGVAAPIGTRVQVASWNDAWLEVTSDKGRGWLPAEAVGRQEPTVDVLIAAYDSASDADSRRKWLTRAHAAAPGHLGVLKRRVAALSGKKGEQKALAAARRELESALDTLPVGRLGVVVSPASVHAAPSELAAVTASLQPGHVVAVGEVGGDGTWQRVSLEDWQGWTPAGHIQSFDGNLYQIYYEGTGGDQYQVVQITQGAGQLVDASFLATAAENPSVHARRHLAQAMPSYLCGQLQSVDDWNERFVDLTTVWDGFKDDADQGVQRKAAQGLLACLKDNRDKTKGVGPALNDFRAALKDGLKAK